MARNLKEGDEIVLRFEVRKVWDDGKVSLSHPLYPNRITITADEIPDEDVIKGTGRKPFKPAPIIFYEVIVGGHVIHKTYNRDEAYDMAGEVEGARVEETPMTGRKKKR